MDNSMQNRIIPNSATSNAIAQIEERDRRQKLQNKLSSSPYVMKSPTSASPAKDEAPGISSVSSQDSTHTTNSVASRRQRIMALSAKNKAAQQRRAYGNARAAVSPKNADKPRTWQSPKSRKIPEPIDTNLNVGDAMEDYDGKEQSSCSEAPPTPTSSTNGISNRIRNFQRENDRESPPPPPPPTLPETQNSASKPPEVEPVNKFKTWSDREQRERNVNVNRVVAYPTQSPSWKGKLDSPSSAQAQTRSNRVVVPRSPTASVGSVDSSSFSGYQPKPPSSTTSRNTPTKQTWNSNNRPHVGNRVIASPEVHRTFSSPKYGSPQPRYSTGSRPSIENYRNMLKPIKTETEVHKSHEKEAYGAIIETPTKSSVSSLHAMFDSQKSTPLMPMTSTNSSVRHSLPLRSPVTPSSTKSGGVGGRYRSPTVRSNVRHSFDESDDRSVSSARSASSVNRQRPPVVASWSQKQQAEKNEKTEEKSRVRQYYNASWRMQSPVNHEKSVSRGVPDNSWQHRVKPRPLETDVQDSPLRSTEAEGSQVAEVNPPKIVEPRAPSQFSIASMMYSQNANSAPQNINAQEAAVDWPTVSNEKPTPGETEVEDSLTDIILDSISDVVPNDLHLPSMLDSRPKNEEKYSSEPPQGVSNKNSSGVKPWENDTKHSIVQSWQNHASKSKDSASAAPPVTEASERSPVNKSEYVAASVGADVAPEEQNVGSTVGEVMNDTENQPDLITTKSSGDSYIEEKKSGDLSFDEDAIIGENIDGLPSQEKETAGEPSQHGDSTHPRKEPFYDDDSYLSRGDTASRGLAASESMRTTSGRSRTLATLSSEDMSVYVEDERIISKTEDKILSAQLEQMNLEVAVVDSDSKAGEETVEEEKAGEEIAGEEKDLEAKTPSLPVDAIPTVKPNLPRLNPSPRDCDEYRNKYFEDSGDPSATSARVIRKKSATLVGSVQSKKSIEKQVIDIWATTSQEERDEAISFDETDRWLDIDPEVADDESASSDHEEPTKAEPEPRPILIKKPRDAFVTPEKQKQRAKAMSSNTKKQASKPQPKQDVFDPFGTDAEEEGGLTVEISEDLFSSNPDPFMETESFSPLEWSGSPRESNTNTIKDTSHSQHIGYYNSPDSRVEI